jgi:hypothetical protein
MLGIGISVALSAAVLAHGISTGEAADKLKAGKASTKSDPDRPVVLGTVPNPKYPKVKKVDALTWTMKGTRGQEKADGKARGKYPTDSQDQEVGG